MSYETDGGPAFPATEANFHNENMRSGGMSLRDYFAAKALPIAAEQFKRFVDPAFPEEGVFLHQDGYEATARAAYALADAMLAEREK